MDEYKKLKCVFCGYELASKAKEPRCPKCGSRRFNAVAEFSATKPFRKPESETMSKKAEPQQAPQPVEKPAAKPKQPVDDEDDEDDDLFGGW